VLACFGASMAFGYADSPDPARAGAKRHSLVSLSGSATGLFPGASVPLPVKVRNRGARPLVITRIQVLAGAPGAACAGSNLRVAIPKRSGLRLGAHASATTTLSLQMLQSAPDACQGATIPLRFKARARRG